MVIEKRKCLILQSVLIFFVAILLISLVLFFFSIYKKELTWKQRIDEKRDIPTLYYGKGMSLETDEPLNNSNIDKVALLFLDRNFELLHINTKNLRLFKTNCDKPSFSNKEICSASFVQYYNSLLIWKSLVIVTTINGKIVYVKNEYFPNINISTIPKISETKAETIVKEELQTEKSAESIKLIIYPQENPEQYSYHLTWLVNMPDTYEPGEEVHSYTYFVDAHTGEIVYRFDRLISFSGEVTGEIYPTNAKTEAQIEVPFAHEKINVAGVEVATNEFGEYTVDVQEGLLIFSELKSPFVEVFESLLKDIDVTTKAVYEDTNPTWNWKDSDISYNQEESNIFYHINLVHDFFTKGDPFDIVDLDYPLKSYVQWTEEDGEKPSCNAKAKYEPKLVNECWLRFYTANDECESSALFSDIIYHEYIHCVIYHVYDNMLEPYLGETGGMNEGLADYFATTINDDPCLDSFRYDKVCMRDLEDDFQYPQDYDEEAHAASKVFSASLWDIREFLGKEFSDDLVILAMKNFQPQTFSEFIIALLSIDDNLNDGTPHANEICTAFLTNHGIFSSECLGYTDLPVAFITSPPPVTEEENYFPQNKQIIVEGTAFGSQFSLQSYSVEYANEESPNTWSSQGMTLVGGEVVEDVLAIWDTSSAENGFHTIRLTVTDTNGQTKTATTNIHLGWPKYLEDHKSPIIGDIDNDDDLEIVIGSSSPNQIHVWHHDGSDAEGWPKTIEGKPHSSPALADLNNDGTMEIVAATSSHLYAWNHDGTLFDSNGDGIEDWPQVISSYFSLDDSSPALADLDNDENLEIIIGGSGENKMYVFRSDGTFLEDWPQETSGKIVTTTAIGDIDLEYSGLEIVATSYDGTIYVWHVDGTPLDGWPKEVGYYLRSSPALGDLDSDGDLEIIVTAGKKVYAWHHDGNLMGGWENQQIDKKSDSSISLGDLNGDGTPEVFLPRKTLYAWNASGTLLWEYLLSTHASSPALGDVDGDGDIDLVVGSYEQKMYAFDKEGTVVEDWPKSIKGDISQSPAIGDLDNDGDVEVISGSNEGHVYVWDLPGKYDKKKMEWPMFHHDTKNTRLYRPKCLKPVDDLYLNEDTILCLGVYSIADSESQGAIIINSSNIVLDCQGATLIGSGSGRGIFNWGHHNVTIKDCHLKNYTNGIYLYKTKNNTLLSNTAEINKWSGIYLVRSNSTTLANNAISSNHHGVDLHSSHNNTLFGNNASANNSVGIYLKSSEGNNIINNKVNLNSYGIELHENSNENIISDNVANSNIYFGISTHTSDKNTLLNNQANFNQYGLLIEAANDNLVEENTFSENDFGIYLFSTSENNQLVDNFVCFNKNTDIFNKEADYNPGEQNVCETILNWNGKETEGCTFKCS